MADLHERIRAWWDEDAHVYDASVGHSMGDPVEAAAWRSILRSVLPPPPARVLDVGAGTGALSLLASELDFTVTALDLSTGMLARARAKAAEQGAEIEFVEGPAHRPPPGPFEAVIERHVAWTLPEPVEAMRAWLRVTVPGGRLVLFEGSWAGEGPATVVKRALASAVARAYGVDDDHHAPYAGDIRAELPLGRTTSPAPFVRAVAAAGWQRVRLMRLRDVEWVVERRAPWPLGWLEHRPRYALVADAP
jgi:ubiquinone/menaquinone biosynthesis C-methylase UbiE